MAELNLRDDPKEDPIDSISFGSDSMSEEHAYKLTNVDTDSIRIIGGSYYGNDRHSKSIKVFKKDIEFLKLALEKALDLGWLE